MAPNRPVRLPLLNTQNFLLTPYKKLKDSLLSQQSSYGEQNKKQ